MEKIVLIDAYSMLHRAFYGIPNLTNSEGMPTNAVYGFLNTLFKITEEENPQYLAAAFDVHAPTFRHQMYDGYKATRQSMPEDLRSQIPLAKDLLAAMGIPCLMKEGLEADDVLGTIARQAKEAGLSVVILSGDRDLLQLADDNVRICLEKTKGGKTDFYNYYAKDVEEEIGVSPHAYIDVKALMGDSSDNIPGVPAIGEKTAVKIIRQFGSIENAREHADEIKPARAASALIEHYDLAVLSKKLATIRTDGDIAFDREALRIRNFYTEEAYALMKQAGFKSFLPRFEKEISEKEEDLTWRVIKDPAEAEEFLQKAAEESAIGVEIAVSKEEWKEHLLAFSVTTPKETCFLPADDLLNESSIKDLLQGLLASSSSVYVPEEKKLSALLFPDHTLDLPLSGVRDVHLAAYLLNPLNASYTYDEIASSYLSRTFAGEAEITGKRTYDELSEEELAKILCPASYTAFAAGPILEKKLAESGMLSLYRQVELPLTQVLACMEQTGIRVKREELAAYGESLTEGIASLESEIYEETGETFNILSPKQLGEVLFEKLHYPCAKKTKTGYSTSADVLEKLAPDYPVVQKILDYRQLTKLKSTYATGLSSFICSDERIHGKFHQTITATGRLSSADPNLQNIPVRMELGRAIRKVFVPRDGWIFVDADYSQIELRILAHMSGDESLIEAYREARDIHAVTASKVFHVPLEEVTPLLRRKAKAVNFGIIYGLSAYGLSENLSISRKEANETIDQYFATYPKVKSFLDGLVASAKETGCSVTMFGRRRPIPELTSQNFSTRSFGERVAMNAPIQGTAADIMKIAMNRVETRLEREHLQARLLLQVHDELLVEAPPCEEEEVRTILAEEMSGAADLAVPLAVEVSSGANWFETK